MPSSSGRAAAFDTSSGIRSMGRAADEAATNGVDRVGEDIGGAVSYCCSNPPLSPHLGRQCDGLRAGHGVT